MEVVMKITKEKIRELVVEQISEAMGYQLRTNRPEALDKDIPYISGKIRDAVFDALEELGYTYLQTTDFRARLDLDPSFTDAGEEYKNPIGRAVEDYLSEIERRTRERSRELDSMGGKPRSR
jgi:hypothetical protein